MALYVIDGYNWIFRSYYAKPKLTTSRGEPTGALSGFCAMLFALLKTRNDITHLLVAMDSGKPGFRNRLYPKYKANRKAPPDDLKPQFKTIRTFLGLAGIPVDCRAGVEADDIIGSYARIYRKHGVYILSSDKDMLQYVGPKVKLYDTMKKHEGGPELAVAKFGVPPDKVPHVQALIGDTIDNVPGVKGFGPKLAARYIKEYGDLEACLKNASSSELPKAAMLATAESRKMARISYKLVLGKPVRVKPLKDLAHRPVDYSRIRPFLERYELRSARKAIKQLPPAMHSLFSR